VSSGNDVNSENYWDHRFQADWDSNSGDKQSVFFATLALQMLPKWFTRRMKTDALSFCDWGCAEGDGTALLARQFAGNTFTGIDFSDTAIDKAKSRHSKVSFEAVDVLTEGYSKQYDVVFSSNVFEHFHKPWDTFDTVSRLAKQFFIMQVPFNEPPKARIPEHFASFSFDGIPFRHDGWSVVHFAVRDTEHLPGTYWAGSQAVVIFAREEVVPKLGLSFEDVSLYSPEYDASLRQIDEMKKDWEGEAAHLREQISKQKEELEENWKLLNSRRWKLANSLGQGFNRVAPRGTPQRAAIRAGLSAAKAARGLPTKARQLSFQRELVRLALSHKSIIVHSGMPWDNIMRQRPHHIAEGLAALGQLFIYVDPMASEPRILSENLVIVGDYNCIKTLSPLKKMRQLYFLSPAGFPTAFSELDRIKRSGFQIIYEYIDELDESISGDLTKQKEVFKRLPELEPVLLLASAKKLYTELEQRFPKSKILLSENGVDAVHFAPVPQLKKHTPEELKPILKLGQPIIGYYGALAQWVDYDLIDKLAREKPNYQILLIGIDYNGGLSGLRRRDNIHYLGPRNYQDLPRYSYWFDCAIIPFVEGEIAKSTSPVKLFEYMAMGLPTVCTRDLNECRGYDGVLMSKDHQAFIKNIDKAIRMKQDKAARNKLMAYAKANTWAARAKAIVNRLEELR